MIASAIQLRDFVEQFRSTVPDDIHPVGIETIRAWFWEMTDAAHHGDPATVAKFARMVERRVEQELEWERESLECANPKNWK